MTTVEKDRLVEVLFYLYFNNKDSKSLGKTDFWNAILSICKVYDVDSNSVAKAVRILTAPENEPNDREIYYLLNKIGLSVRPINKISGVYWQKQKEYLKEFDSGKIPSIKNRIFDVVMKRSMRDFIFIIYDFMGVFNNIDIDIIDSNL